MGITGTNGSFGRASDPAADPAPSGRVRGDEDQDSDGANLLAAEMVWPQMSP
jgi:hypothetical protein